MFDKKSLYVRDGGDEIPGPALFNGGVLLRFLCDADGGVLGLAKLEEGDLCIELDTSRMQAENVQ